MTYTSPTRGKITFGWDKALTVKDQPVPLRGYKRFDNPWAQVDFDTKHYVIKGGGSTLDLDFDKGTRTPA